MALSPFDDRKDAQDAFHHLNGKHNWKLDFSHYSRDGGDRSGCVHRFGELAVATAVVIITLIPIITAVQASIPFSLPLYLKQVLVYLVLNHLSHT